MSTDIDTLRPELAAGLERWPAAALATPLLAYLALLARWNAPNLTAIRDPRDMVAKHLLDSLAMQPFVRGLRTLADLGTGPGLPGIPLAIAARRCRSPWSRATAEGALPARGRARQLGLGNVQVANRGSRRSARARRSTPSPPARWPRCR